ncbi:MULTISPECIES: DUF6439 family protein [Prochlorococcus]|uniref:Uncharacterized protein n=1 Tax=Prochlorococcus marinus (strain SARG / CCMP1375 / SS120) TaxID=167539 RepID=Q7VCG5_PROMA|nr:MULTISPECIES: DUF6439 family protein [Prochlorococcus]AAP99819.1 Uncharacterized protein Pro_0775 [Prochlorococcus marinus subsp. marinus str. CCMP1375]KGG11836.1 hypothetical protein EV04_0861 [Prochlorococcus marinus str. LG]KGG21857.1 hypothetical protein EV08_0462 [Prochlorococcus marinus str. SS2]KGG23712.1 hypothetical protein EV09_1337 [Prochlorococcus marinus str. SS35]KGG32052.1 hypothetical protein EV10_1166 [Prochlorococcus marinus str. SS51]
MWTSNTKKLIKELHSELTLNDKDWHKFKANKSLRAAEMLSSALSQIVNNGEKSDIEDLIEQSLKWIRGEIKDPGCPSH